MALERRHRRSDNILAPNRDDRYDSHMSKSAKHVVIPLFPDVELLDVAGPAGVFTEANLQARREVYRVHFFCQEPKGFVRSSCGLMIRGKRWRSIPRDIDTLIVPGAEREPLVKALANQELVSAIGCLQKRSARRTSVCSGAFFLGQLGVLDGRRVTTHWEGIRELEEWYPSATVVQDSLYEHDGDVWTSAGVLSGVDMMLALVRQDLGAELALRIARRLVVFLVRDGGQPQFSAPMQLQSRASGLNLDELVSWLESRLPDSTTVDDMADHMAVSVRTLHRRCVNAFGLTPAKLFNELRLEHARSRLHAPHVPVKQIAHECGFSSQPALSKAFTQRFGVSPSRYREKFRDAA